MYLVSDLDAYTLADTYAEFWKTFTWYRMYCVAKFGKNKSDYKEGLESLKTTFRNLSESDDVAKYIKEPVTTLLERIESRLNRKRFGNTDIEYIAELLWEFENNQDNFGHKYLDGYLKQTSMVDLPKGMSSITQLLSDDEGNSAIVDSFKYLDGLLQKLLDVSPHGYYGESLVNLAFSPTDGKIRLGTHENEQRGLRNLTSGLYALFRNPAAHRDVFDSMNGILRYDGKEQAAATITVMVSLLARLIYENVYRNLNASMHSELVKAARTYGWDQEVLHFAWRFKYSWGIGLLPTAKHKTLRECQLIVSLTEDYQGPLLEVTVNTELEKDDIEKLKKDIYQASNLRTTVRKL